MNEFKLEDHVSIPTSNQVATHISAATVLHRENGAPKADKLWLAKIEIFEDAALARFFHRLEKYNFLRNP